MAVFCILHGLFLEHGDHSPDGSLRHELERLVNIFQTKSVSVDLIHRDLASHVVLDDSRQLSAPPDASERTPAPHTPSDQLERSGCDLNYKARKKK